MSANPEMPDDFDELAADLKQAIPPLSPEALTRVQGRMQVELDRLERRRRWRGVVMGGLLAASVAVAVVGYAVTYAPQRRDPPAIVERPGDLVIDERIQLAVRSASIAPVVERPLVRLDENRALFMD